MLFKIYHDCSHAYVVFIADGSVVVISALTIIVWVPEGNARVPQTVHYEVIGHIYF